MQGDYLFDMGIEIDEKYNRKCEAPIYQPSAIKPKVHELVDENKTTQLKQRIARADIPDDVRRFLNMAADRHLVFQYAKIADYYTHATPEVQELMEQSALVIIDFDKAIEEGYARLSDSMREAYGLDHVETDSDD